MGPLETVGPFAPSEAQKTGEITPGSHRKLPHRRLRGELGQDGPQQRKPSWCRRCLQGPRHQTRPQDRCDACLKMANVLKIPTCVSYLVSS